jgi:hypothetical protein
MFRAKRDPTQSAYFQARTRYWWDFARGQDWKRFHTDHADGVHRYKRSRGIAVPRLAEFLPYHAAVDHELLELFGQRGAAMKFHKGNLTGEELR